MLVRQFSLQAIFDCGVVLRIQISNNSVCRYRLWKFNDGVSCCNNVLDGVVLLLVVKSLRPTLRSVNAGGNA